MKTIYKVLTAAVGLIITAIGAQADSGGFNQNNPAVPLAVPGPTMITSLPVAITVPGNYQLAFRFTPMHNNDPTSAFSIQAQGVTVDLQGQTVSCINGIRILTSYATVKNGSFVCNGTGAGDGVLVNGNSFTLEHLQFIGGFQEGILFSSATGGLVQDCLFDTGGGSIYDHGSGGGSIFRNNRVCSGGGGTVQLNPNDQYEGFFLFNGATVLSGVNVAGQ